ncbi:Endonuclease/exonuclease/phosphatase [Senna tora]|uniref:Endonuclease/exonuclease/phosphatase n=1 Tax=Senna tora TaxID=362788 RepID=A0A834TUR0_9FABA|nr:Endonuclease/exonuclease/phosphatase [Senna tora]
MLPEDHLKVSTASSCLLGSSPILVRQWIPNFSHSIFANCPTSTIWMKLLYLPIEYHHPEILVLIGNAIGSPSSLGPNKPNQSLTPSSLTPSPHRASSTPPTPQAPSLSLLPVISSLTPLDEINETPSFPTNLAISPSTSPTVGSVAPEISLSNPKSSSLQLLISPPHSLFDASPPNHSDASNPSMDSLPAKTAPSQPSFNDLVSINSSLTFLPSSSDSSSLAKDLQGHAPPTIAKIPKYETGTLNYHIMLNSINVPLPNPIEADPIDMPLPYSSDSPSFMPYSPSTPKMHILACNCNGAGASDFPRLFRDMMLLYQPDVVILTKTRISEYRASNVVANLGFICFHKVDTMGFSSGIWLLWNPRAIYIELVDSSFQDIHCLVKVLWVLSLPEPTVSLMEP